VTSARDRILIVENDPVISDFIARQTLQAAGYQPVVVNDVTSAISRSIQMAPDLILVNINMPDLRGKDLMVALNSQGINTPVIVMAIKGMEAELIQTLRLGAADYLLWPLREPEVLNAVERVLKQVHERQERERLSRQLQQTNQELQARVRELTTIFSLGKAVTSITEQAVLFEKIIEGAASVTQADMAWFLLREDSNVKTFTLVGQRNLPPSLVVFLNQPWDDGISSLVAMSGESLSIHGEPLKRFKINTLGQSALIAPVKLQKQVIGLLVMLRKQPQPFSASEQNLLEAVADYAGISLVNARLFRTVEERAHSLQTLADVAQVGEKINHEILDTVKREVRSPLEISRAALERLAKDPTTRWSKEQRQALTALQDQLQIIGRIGESIAPPSLTQSMLTPAPLDVIDLVRKSIERLQPIAQQNNVILSPEFPPFPFQAQGETVLLGLVLDAMISLCVRYSSAGNQVSVRIERKGDMAEIAVQGPGPALDSRRAVQLFEPGYRPPSAPPVFAGLTIGLSLALELVQKQNGKLWAEGKSGQNVCLHLELPLSR